MRKLLYGILTLVLCALIGAFVLDTTSDKIPDESAIELPAQKPEPIKAIAFQQVYDSKNPGMMELIIYHDKFIETYTVSSTSDKGSSLSYSALKPDNEFGITLKSIQVLQGRDLIKYDHRFKDLPAKHSYNYMLAKIE